MMDDEKYEKARSRVKELRDFYKNLLTYVGVNILLIIINLITSPGKLWFYWVTIFWGIGIVLHASKVFVLKGKFLGKEWEEKKDKRNNGKREQFQMMKSGPYNMALAVDGVRGNAGWCMGDPYREPKRRNHNSGFYFARVIREIASTARSTCASVVKGPQAEADAAPGEGANGFMNQRRAVKAHPHGDIEVRVQDGAHIARIHSLDIQGHESHMIFQIPGAVGIPPPLAKRPRHGVS